MFARVDCIPNFLYGKQAAWQRFFMNLKKVHMKKKLENPNDHKRKTPSTKGKEDQAGAFTSYDTSNSQTSSPQKVRESKESTAEMEKSLKR